MMRVAVVGGTGTLGSRVVQELTDRGHEPRVLSRRAGSGFRVDLATGAGLPEALSGVDAVIDASSRAGSLAAVPTGRSGGDP